MFEILDEMSELVYVADMQTYELYYINYAGRELFHLGDYKGEKCYRVLQGLDSPCRFCTNSHLVPGQFYTWEKTNQVLGRHFLLKDKIMDWEGKQARVEIAFDTTEQEARRKEISEALELQKVVTECAKRLYEADENTAALNEVLEIAGRYLQSDRVYIFEIHGDRMDNTYEWCAPGVEAQIEKLKAVPLSLIDRWRQPLKESKYVIVEDVEGLRDISPDEYGVLKAQAINSMIAVPLMIKNHLIGYAGVDNFAVEMKENTTAFLRSVGYFIAAMLRQQRTLAQLEKLSYFDPLTGIKNRNAYGVDLKKEYRAPAGVICVDINGMKQLNDLYGHQYGDEVLCALTKELISLFSSARCYRIGGDEFQILCEGMEKCEFCEKIQELKNHLEFHADYFASLGFCWSDKFASIKEVVCQADEAMFQDKKAFYRGRALSKRYRHQTDDILGLTDPEKLRNMIRAGQFHVYYQPKVDIKTKKVSGAEALVRYVDTSGTLYAPDQFIPVLEEARQISAVDFYVFEQVCAQLREWKRNGILTVPVSTNFSRHTLSVEGFAERLQKICAQYDISRDLLEVEVTETVEADNRRLFFSAIEQLNERKFRISIDDFGVNNANLSLLTDVDFHVLKIDKHVTENICTNQKSRLLVAALVEICHQMEIEIIAEGVETEEQLAMLREMGCDVAQGYLFGKPMPVGDFFGLFLR